MSSNVSSNTQKIVSFIRERSDWLIMAGVGLFMLALWWAIFELGRQFNQGTILSLIVPTALVMCLIAHGAACSDELSRIRLINGLAFGGHLIITVALSVFFVLQRSTVLQQTAGEFLSEFVELGRTFYSALFGLGIAISLTAIVASKATRVATVDSGASAIAGIATNFAVLLAIATSSIHLYNFGANIARLSVIETLSATVMADVAFLAIKANIQTQLDVRKKLGRYDFFDLVVWSIFGIAVAVYLILINAYTVAEASGLQQDLTLRATIVRLYGMSPTVLLLGIAALTILTKTVDFSSDRLGKSQSRALPPSGSRDMSPAAMFQQRKSGAE